VAETNKPLCGHPELIIGSKPIDDGHFIFEGDERREFLRRERRARKFLHPFVGSEEFLNDGDGSILYLEDAPHQDLREMLRVKERVEAVRAFRLKSKSAGTRQLADSPTSYFAPRSLFSSRPCSSTSGQCWPTNFRFFVERPHLPKLIDAQPAQV
jgi:hypothetical protein